MLIGEDYISNDVITLGACFQVFFNVCLHSPSFRFPLIGGNLTAQSTWSHRAIVGGIQVPETYTSPSLNPRALRRACPQAIYSKDQTTIKILQCNKWNKLT